MKEASRFFDALYGNIADGEVIEIRCIGTRKGMRLRPAFYKTTEEAAKAALLRAESSNVCFGVATRDGKGGKKNNISRIHCAWADLDDKPLLGNVQERLESSPIKPSAVVCSGKGLHCYWFLAEPLVMSDN